MLELPVVLGGAAVARHLSRKDSRALSVRPRVSASWLHSRDRVVGSTPLGFVTAPPDPNADSRFRGAAGDIAPVMHLARKALREAPCRSWASALREQAADCALAAAKAGGAVGRIAMTDIPIKRRRGRMNIPESAGRFPMSTNALPRPGLRRLFTNRALAGSAG